ncbi:type I polyketide synthase [Limimaricola pyoseonensis]|uniref:Acyl transferase domain-containing protein n=1 Tax=Limimaricola pyoseonensis TaxID=521013 RepID=A0A1G7K244_9RHOB|nr:type I polyketide synthase [Limimaricola pyoseonensis]SDF31356.1 Acyl transferase domain-containing protein [Limimaricola pyoseonensis]
MDEAEHGLGDIAIIGMGLRLPGAATLDAFWAMLREGRSAIRRLTPAELSAAGEPARLTARPDYVPYGAPLEGYDRFDAGLFGLSAKEAAVMDPQHRQFLEAAWEAFDNAGHAAGHAAGGGGAAAVGVFAGCGESRYYNDNLLTNPELVEETGTFLLRHTGNDKDFLATRLSHMLDLTGPSVTLQTACSTSLVAVHMAAQALLDGECDMALAGGATVELPQGRGYLYRENEILSPDGACRAFEARAAGTVFGSGAGAVVLRRLEDALADGDHVWAVLKGSAINNDGARKAGYLAPSVDGQAAAVTEALRMAGVSGAEIGFVECHGTGTALGDPIELAALAQGLGPGGECHVGSVKANVGHTDTAAGVISLIKAALALHHGEIPPQPDFTAPNPRLDLGATRFRIADRARPWPRDGAPRRAAVNSLGVGGTNAHAVLEEAPERAAPAASDWPFQLICLSGRTEAALDANAARLAAHLRARPDQPLADVAHTLASGRPALSRRRVLVAHDHAEAARLLETGEGGRVFSHAAETGAEIVFMFPGGGSQYPGMARGLFETEPVFRDWMERGLLRVSEQAGRDMRALWLPGPGMTEEAEAELRRPALQLPLILAVEHALAQLWMSWGVMPDRLIGHSMGENAAAALAGVTGFEAALDLVHLRGRLFEETEPGAMLSVALGADALRAELGPDLDLAAINGPGLTVASGPVAAIAALERRLAARQVETRRIPIAVAAHSRLLDPVLGRFEAHLGRMALSPPTIPILSNRTGQPLDDGQATDPAYWVAHLRDTVDFDHGLRRLADRPRIFIEVGPGQALSSLAAMQPGIGTARCVPSLRHARDTVADDVHFVGALGRVWAMGGPIDRDQLFGEGRRRVVLPGYAFQRDRHFIAPGNGARDRGDAPAENWPEREDDPARWIWRPDWRRSYPDGDYEAGGDLADQPVRRWLILADESGVGAETARRLRAAGHDAVVVRAGVGFAREGRSDWVLDPQEGGAGYAPLLEALAAEDRLPDRVLHLWLLTGADAPEAREMQGRGLWSLFHLARAWSEVAGERGLHLLCAGNELLGVTPQDRPVPAKAAVIGPVLALPRELPGVTAALLDLGPVAAPEQLVGPLLEEALAAPADTVAAWRGGQRRQRRAVRAQAGRAWPVRRGGPVLITGGFGGMGLALAEALIREEAAPIALLSRRALPPRDRWPEIAASGDTGAAARAVRAVLRLEALGGHVLPLAADVTDAGQMRAALERAEAALGRLSGVIHAAGRLDDAPMLLREPAAAEAVLAPKLRGLEVLDALLPDGRLDWMALCASVSGWAPAAGQADYAAANAALDAFAQARSGGRTAVVAIDWGIWADVGMAAEALAPPPPAPQGRPVALPMLDRRIDGSETGPECEFEADWSAEARWFLDQHRLATGEALLPGTGYLELAAEALGASGFVPFEVEGLRFKAPLRAPAAGTTRLRLRQAGDRLEIRAALPGEGFATTAEMQARPLGAAAPAPLDIAGITERLGGAPRPDTALPQPGQLRFGAQWQVLRATRRAGREGLARLEADATAAPGMALHPGLLDIATGWALDLVPGHAPDRLWVPTGYDRVRVYAPLAGEILSHVRLSEAQEEGRARFDVTLADPDGRVLVEVEGLWMLRLEAGLDLPAPVPGGAVPGDDPATLRLRHNLARGIRAREAGAALRAALGAGLPQVAVSALPLPALQRQISADRPRPAPAAPPPAVAAGLDTETERRIAGFWQGLLGAEALGPDDSFFDLGGHSLLAVRLFAMIRREIGPALPISTLIEAPTLRALAARVDAARDHGTETVAGNAAARPGPPAGAGHTHLVRLSEGGDGAPLFIAAGMFGNVMNLRRLAQLLGKDRPVWGLQARGLIEGHAPHRSIEAAASDMLGEMRQVHPGGAWHLAGYSGGGITAWQMAQQLAAEGDEVAALILLDTPLPRRAPLAWRDRAAIQAIELRRAGLAYPLRWAAQRLRWEIGRRRFGRLEGVAAAAEHDPVIEAAFYEALAGYTAPGWAGPATLLRPAPRPHWRLPGGRLVSAERQYILPDNGWGGLAPRLEVIEVPGDHDSMVLDPNVAVLAARLRPLLAAAPVRPGQLAAAE